MKIYKVSPRKYEKKVPKVWHKLVGLIPDIRLNFLNECIVNSRLLRKIVNKIPARCPFSRAYEIEFQEFGKRHLLLYIPPLCKLNPFYNWIIDLKVEVFDYRRKQRELESLAKL